MNDTKEIYRTRIQKIHSTLESIEDQASSRVEVEYCFIGTIGILESLYGKGSQQLKSVHDIKKSTQSTQYGSQYQISLLRASLQGVLENTMEELDGGLIRNIYNEGSGVVLGDLVALAKDALHEDHISVASVLASAALEDAIKRKAEQYGISTENKKLPALINALKAQSFFSGAQASIVSSYTKLRNSSMHADWDKIEKADVSSLIGFLEPFLLENFSSSPVKP